jgi:hypothetical protein
MLINGRVRMSALGTAFIRPEAKHEERSIHRALAKVFSEQLVISQPLGSDGTQPLARAFVSKAMNRSNG